MTSGAEPWCPAVGDLVVTFWDTWTGQACTVSKVVKVTAKEITTKEGDRAAVKYRLPHYRPVGDPYGPTLQPLTEANRRRVEGIRLRAAVLHDLHTLRHHGCKVPVETLRALQPVLRAACQEAGL